MNERRWIILGLLLPLLFGGWAWFLSHRAPRFGAEWQPHRLGGFYVESQPTTVELFLDTNQTTVRSVHYVFDLKTRQESYSLYGGITGNEGEMWELVEDAGKTLHLQVNGGKTPFRYNVPAALQQTIRNDMRREAGLSFHQWGDMVGLMTDSDLYRWKKRRATMIKPLVISASGAGYGIVDEKHQQVIYVDGDGISRLSANDGRLIKRFSPSVGDDITMLSLMNYGSFAGFGAPTGAGNQLNWKLYDVATERFMWSFETEDEHAPAFFSHDKQRHYLAVPARQIWEVRDGKTGAVVQTLPLVEATRGAALSPDDKTLYCVSNSSLYRQRAR